MCQGWARFCTFKDADGGPAGEESEDEFDPADLADVTEQEEGEGEGEGEEDEEAEEGMEDSDEEEEDDTALWACGDAPETPPEGYVYAPCPPLATPEDHDALIGRRVLVAHNTDPIGWHVARARFKGLSQAWRKSCPTANFLLRYTKKETHGEMPDGSEEARELSTSNYGHDEWWILLDPVE